VILEDSLWWFWRILYGDSGGFSMVILEDSLWWFWRIFYGDPGGFSMVILEDSLWWFWRIFYGDFSGCYVDVILFQVSWWCFFSEQKQEDGWGDLCDRIQSSQGSRNITGKTECETTPCAPWCWYIYVQSGWFMSGKCWEIFQHHGAFG